MILITILQVGKASKKYNELVTIANRMGMDETIWVFLGLSKK